MSKVDKPLPVVDIDTNIKAFFDNREENRCLPDERNASFDYCYNYFQEFRRNNKISEIASSENLERSCIQISFFLASWGMLRGSAFLSKKSAHHYKKLIDIVAKEPESTWAIDVDQYGDTGSTEILLELTGKIRKAISLSGTGEEEVSEILITKIILGIFGNIPAFDSYFLKGFGNYWVNKESLKIIYDFYMANGEIIDGYKIPTIGFVDGEPTSRSYPQAKIIDMIFFMEGDKLFKAEEAIRKQAKSKNKR
ncbi:hypothetical protein [Deinococcus arenicola]|uniref:HEPN domain-containing protein n=1 Tax=Deinococcus arenicola TaxID=2994950 RepID=A0ABU4DKU3_9DEIO|nr:hypothetical protein [Deinococcus sp. ZS9-10]MDV6373053.1 hypothetical protein [Deinococcus sp. ZS9-10]